MATQQKKKREGAGATQKFIEIKDIVEDIVLLSSGNACSVIEVTASNFALLSKEEQDAKIFAYASLLNSLSFPIQIVVQNKRIDISLYVKQLDLESQKTKNQQLASYISLYRDFVSELVKINTVLDKKFYIVVPYSYLERGVAGTTSALKEKSSLKGHAFWQEAQKALATKTTSMHAQLARVGLPAKTLEKEELIKVFYGVFNEDLGEAQQGAVDYDASMVKTI